MSYQKKTTLEAFQMTEAAWSDQGSWPAWLTTAAARSSSVLNSVHPNPRDGDLAVVSTLKGYIPIVWNDWIVQDAGGNLDVVGPTEFSAGYESI